MDKKADTAKASYSEVVLTSYPSCDECLQWSEDGLAVAAGSNVSLICRKQDTKSAEGASWVNTNIRTDLFTQDEWPEHSITTINSFSIGEEQSDSTVVALSWSTNGIGLHRRYVLGVLTSNLLLSIWETNGSDQGWRRTLIVNNFLGRSEDRVSHQKRYIRVFCWVSTPSVALNHNHDDQQKLLVVDDTSFMSLLSIHKQDRSQYGNWQVSTTCSTQLLDFQESETGQGGDLYIRLGRGAKITRLCIDKWDVLSSSDDQVDGRATIRYGTTFKASIGSVVLKLELSLARADAQFVEHIQNPEPFQKDSEPNCGMASPVDDEWKNILDHISSKFQRKHDIHEARFRIWGSAVEVQQHYRAICVTMHPCDTVEYTSAVQEMCHVLIKSSKKFKGDNDPSEGSRTARDVLRSVATLVIASHSHHSFIHSTLEKQLLCVLCAAAKIAESTDLQSGLSQMSQEDYDDKSIETCIICDSAITMRNLKTSRCESGHVFIRCGLTFMSIQEPGISKYCSGCRKQFLYPLKLGPLTAGNIIEKIFDSYDICPYCRCNYYG